MKKISEELNKVVDEVNIKLKNFTQEDWNYRSAPGKWSRKEILGHLIDSAANNHHRFVKVQFEDIPTVTYDQDKWSAAQHCTGASSENLIELWTSYNKYLVYILSRFPEDMYNHLCNAGKDQPVTIEWIASDYLRHLNHHLKQILD